MYGLPDRAVPAPLLRASFSFDGMSMTSAGPGLAGTCAVPTLLTENWADKVASIPWPSIFKLVRRPWSSTVAVNGTDFALSPALVRTAAAGLL